MKLWQVIANGDGFVRSGQVTSFELTGFIEADNPNAAFLKACNLALKAHPELSQATGPFPHPVINADEIQEVNGLQSSVDEVEVEWK